MGDRLADEQERLAKVVQIRDLSGLSISTVVGSAPIMGRITAVMTNSLDAYPETIRTVFVINAPSGFELFWALVSPLMSQRTQDKVKFVDLERAREIVAVAGNGFLEALGRLRAVSTNAQDHLDIAAGASAYGLARVAEGSSSKWSFFIDPEDTDFNFSVVFFPDDPKASSFDIPSSDCLLGCVSGSFDSEESGVLWATWSNTYWLYSKAIKDIKGFVVLQ